VLGATSFPVIILTGLSGSGKSTALRVFEDLRFFCVDNLPASLAPKLVKLYSSQNPDKYRGLALGMDLRQPDFLEQWNQAKEEFQAMDLKPQVLFFEADSLELVRRYSETRRPHPLQDSDLGLEQALIEEKKLLSPLRGDADLIIDTTKYSIHDLRRKLQEKWDLLGEHHMGLRVHVISFGFKYGVPAEADLVFDLRFLPNPHFDPDLKPLTGRDQEVLQYVLTQDPGRTFLKKYTDFLLYLLPLYASEGRYRMTLALGCTGGRHRSVAVAEQVFDSLKKADYVVSLEHRHIGLG